MNPRGLVQGLELDVVHVIREEALEADEVIGLLFEGDMNSLALGANYRSD